MRQSVEQISNLSLFLLFLAMVLVSAFFSGAETAMMSVNRYRLRHMSRNPKNKWHKSALRVATLLEHPDRLLGIILTGNTFANVFSSAIFTVLAQRLLGGHAIEIATLFVTFFLLIFSEISPKTLAAMYPQPITFLTALPLKFLQVVLYPVVYVVTKIAKGFLLLFGVHVKKQELEHFSNEEFRTVLREAGKMIPIERQEMMLSILDLEKTSVEDIMVPRHEIAGINLENDWETILQELRFGQHTRLPLYSGDIDNIQGILHLKQIITLFADDSLTREKLIALAEPAYFVPESTPLSMQVLHFRKEKKRTAFVVDEYGDIQGLITLEDILEEIIGEFTTDFSQTTALIQEEPDGSYLVDAGLHVRTLNRKMKWHLPTNGPKTLSGLITEYLEAMPAPGISMRISRYPIEIISVKDNMVKVARIGVRQKENPT